MLLMSRGVPLTLPGAIVAGVNGDVRRLIREQPGLVNANNNSTGFAPLHFAAKADNLAAIEALLDAGASIDARTKEQQMTPLLMALNYNKPRAARFLVEQGANIAPGPESFQPPLHLAVLQGHPAVVQKMLDRKANINAPNRDGDTPLHLACERENAEMIRFLVAAGANKAALDKNGKTPRQRVQPNRPDLQKQIDAALSGG
jgi:ankyrin repeat protein